MPVFCSTSQYLLARGAPGSHADGSPRSEDELRTSMGLEPYRSYGAPAGSPAPSKTPQQRVNDRAFAADKARLATDWASSRARNEALFAAGQIYQVEIPVKMPRSGRTLTVRAHLYPDFTINAFVNGQLVHRRDGFGMIEPARAKWNVRSLDSVLLQGQCQLGPGLSAELVLPLGRSAGGGVVIDQSNASVTLVGGSPGRESVSLGAKGTEQSLRRIALPST